MSSIEVSNISAQTTEKEIRDFFSFCGKISQLSVKANEKTQVANVTFEKDAAAKTALLLDNTELGGAVVRVAQATTSGPTAQADKPKESTSAVDDPIAQEDKPRTRILAEYMAHGYVVSDNVIDKAINLDSQYGVSKTFMGMLKKVDENLAVTGRAQNLDSTYNISGRAAAGWRGLNSYLEQASQTPTGRRFRAFYDEGQKQVLDVHAEAKHLAMLKQGKQPDSGLHNISGTDRTQCNCGADTTNCPCAPGACACNSCAKNPDTETTKVTPAEAQLKEVKIDGQNKTTCNCGGADNKCPCEPGKCTCNGCSKSS